MVLKKILSADIDRISTDKFKASKLNINGEKKLLRSSEVKQFIKKMARGGRSASYLEDGLRKAGMEGSSFRKRKELMTVISQKDETEKAGLKETKIKKNFTQPRVTKSEAVFAGGKTKKSFGFALGSIKTSSSALSGQVKTGFAGKPNKTTSFISKPKDTPGFANGPKNKL